MAYTQRQAAAALGITLATYQRLERGAEWTDGAAVTIDRRTALACAAIAAGLSEWSMPCGNHRSPGNRSTGGDWRS